MFRKVHINRFKNITDFGLELGQVNVLVGSNNSGKSSVLQAIQFAVSVAQTTAASRAAKWRRDILSSSAFQTEIIYAPLRDVSALAPNGALKSNEREAILVRFTDEHDREASVQVRKGNNKNILLKLTGQPLGEELRSLEEPYSFFVPGLAGIPNEEEYKSRGSVIRAAAKGDANNFLRNILWLLKTGAPAEAGAPGPWQQFLTDFHFLFPDYDVETVFDGNRDPLIAATISKNNSVLPIDSAGTGVLQAIQILSYINLFKPKVLLLDEPDAHLHPNNQRSLASLLVRLAQNSDRPFQVIVATHSRHMLDAMVDDATIVWVDKGELAQGVNLNTISLLLSLGALDRNERLRTGNYRFAFITEDAELTPLRAILESSGFNLNDVFIWSYKGCSNLTAAIGVAEFIRTMAPGITVVVHRDRDYETTEKLESYERSLVAAGLRCFITTGTDIESHFLNADHIHELHPGMEVLKAQELIQQATSLAERKSLEKISGARIDQARMAGQGVGAAGVAAHDEYRNDPVRYRHGKSVLGQLNGLLQRELGGHADLFRPSSHLAVHDLSEIVK